jgi:hypothetical protein
LFAYVDKKGALVLNLRATAREGEQQQQQQQQRKNNRNQNGSKRNRKKYCRRLLNDKRFHRNLFPEQHSAAADRLVAACRETWVEEEGGGNLLHDGCSGRGKKERNNTIKSFYLN